MVKCNRVTHRAALLGGALSILAAGCSPGADRATTGDTAAATTAAARPESSTAASSAMADSSITKPDTTTTAPGGQSATVNQSPAPKPPVKPSIDPGRKKTTPRSSGAQAAPRSASAAPRDSGSSTDSAASDDSASPGSSASAQTTAGSSGPDQWLKYDAATNTVTFELVAGPFNWNGYSNGGATLTLPPKANVVMNFVNKDGTPHSAEVISGQGPIPNAAGDPAIPRAYTNKALEGLPQEGTDVMRFPVPESGSYRIFCGVPGHGLSGMWIWMKIDPAAKTPSFGPTKG